MRTIVLIAVALVVSVALPSAGADSLDAAAAPTTVADASCAPPCGPIVVTLTMLAEKSKRIVFDETNKFETRGVIQYHFDINDEGYAYDPTKEMWIELRVVRDQPWTKSTIEPARIRVPIVPNQCPTCIVVEGDPASGQVAFFYEHPIQVTIEKIGDPTPEQIEEAIRHDGMYRVVFSASSNDSFAGVDGFAKPAGLYEGYVSKDFKIIPPKFGPIDAEAVQPDGSAWSLGALGLVAALAAAFALARRR